MTKTLMVGAFALAMTAAAPAMAQMKSGDSMSPGNSMMKSGDVMKSDMKSTRTTAKMTKSQMTTMKKCKAMPKTAMMKNATCTKMMKMYPNAGGQM